MEQNKIGILVPAFNEANNLKYLIPKLKKLGDLLIVNDGSTDETQILLKSNYCNYISRVQIEHIIKTIVSRNYNKQQIDCLLRSQIVHAIYWAIKYKQPINFKSTFFKAFRG